MHLTFTPYAYAKLAYLRDKGDTEVGGYGIGSTDNPLLITDFFMVDQECSSVFCELDGDDSNRLMQWLHEEHQLSPNETARVWIHTHPGNSATPSSVDETTFKETWGDAPWAVMAILARGGATYARLQYRSKAPATFLADLEPQTKELKWLIDYTQPFDGSDHEAWDAEYDRHLSVIRPQPVIITTPRTDLPARYYDKWSDTRYWERKSAPQYNGYGRLFDSDEKLFEEAYADIPVDPDWLECTDCMHAWKIDDDTDDENLSRCPLCYSQNIDYSDQPPTTWSNQDDDDFRTP